jgi:hypothetical protein
LNSTPCIVVASITPATPPPCDKSLKQQLQIQLRSSCLRCSAGAANADVGQAAHPRLRHSALPPHVQAVYTLQNSDLHSVSKVRCKLACMQAISLASIVAALLLIICTMTGACSQAISHGRAC